MMTVMPATADLLRPGADTEHQAWLRLRTMHVGEQAGWFTYLAGDRPSIEYVLRLPDGTIRHLRRQPIAVWHGQQVRRNESSPWLHGFAAGHRALQLVDAIDPPPATLDTIEAAHQLGITTMALNLRVSAGAVDPIYIARRERRFIAAQIAAIADPGNPDRAREWSTIRSMLPSTVRPHQINATPTPPPDPMPVPPGHMEVTRRLAALRLGASYGWFVFLHSDPDVYTVRLPGGTTVEIPGPSVLPWVWGVGDAHGCGHLVAYR